MSDPIQYLDTDRINTLPVSVATPLPVAMTMGGAANSLANPVFIANAEAGDTTGTFTNGTQTTSVTATNCDGYATALVSINGTYGTATAVFEASDDGGTTWYTIGGARSDGLVAQTGYTSQTNATLQWACPVSGNDSFRVRSTAVASGTVNVRISISSIVTIPSTSVVTGSAAAGTTAVGNPVFVAGWDGATARGLLTDGNGRQLGTLVPNATLGGVTTTRLGQAATTNAANIKASAGQVTSWDFSNNGAAFAYVKLYNKASAPTVGTDAIAHVIGIPAGGSKSMTLTYPLTFTTGISIAVTTGAIDSDATAPAINQVLGSIGFV